ncbi:RagB/SusD family nutrient uptake outer membrane protein [Capnocytophaga felis]|uniref:Membrane protein n=1 Tax=Capnocytophaga felis TaxID=2267611 RepID=A0A5M4B7Y3_9FLAO|nr:RagB/SusD family nutrient uptake outer membrane protein [Capnocytophaga felis]GET45480.1 membrane protein [Capnocytophaga felis]GET47357.1 membrane protein [Capnocytophaga felis]
MKKHIYYIGISLSLLTACDLDKDPISEFSEKNMEQQSKSSKIETKAQMKTQYEAIYSFMKQSGQEFWTLDLLQNTETRADNAYAGATTNSIVSIEEHSQDQSNSNIKRDWNKYLQGINLANAVIVNVDRVTDPTLTPTERKKWKAEARILKAWMLFDMVRFWGDIPIPSLEIPEISSGNIAQTYELLFPERKPVLEVYAEIKSNLEAALADAPEVQANDKFVLNKAVANALLAKVYAEKPIRNYSKTIEYCNAVESYGFTLLNDYADLFQLNEPGADGFSTDVKIRNSAESIFEITYSTGGQNWLTSLFGKNYINPKSRYDWAKWVTPSRDLITAFDAENDQIRKNQAIIWGQPSWSIYYPSDNYPFMYKIRSGANSVIKLRLADILLLKAEAYAALGDLQNATALVNRVRARVKLPPIAPNSQEEVKKAVLNERRLELAFEGHRWFDLVRNDMAIETINSLNTRDSGRLKMKYPLTEDTLLFPVPQSEIENNPKLTQNPGY